MSMFKCITVSIAFRLIALTEELLFKRCKVESFEHIVVSTVEKRPILSESCASAPENFHMNRRGVGFNPQIQKLEPFT